MLVGKVVLTQKTEYIGIKLTLSAPFDKFLVKGCGMGSWLVLVSLCVRENVVATYKNLVFFV